MQAHSRFSNLKIAYITAFCLIALLSTTKQAIIQYTLFRELYLRSYANMLSSQTVLSQRIQRNSLLLLVNTPHTKEDSELARDIVSLEANDARFQSRDGFERLLGGDYHDYSLFVQSHLPKQSAAPYQQLDAATHKLLTIEGQVLAYQARIKAETPFISRIFYSENAHLAILEESQTIVNDDIDAFIHRIQIIELIFWILTSLILACEGLYVVRPALHELSAQEDEPLQQEEQTNDN